MKTPHRFEDCRAAALYREHQRDHFRRTDRLFSGLLLLQALAVLLGAPWLSPAGVIAGGVGLVAFQAIVAALRPGTWPARHGIAVAQVTVSILLVQPLGEPIERSIHLFGSLALLALYRDWRVVVTAALVLAAGQTAWRGVSWVALESTALVLVEAGFLLYACLRGERDVKDEARRQAAAEAAQRELLLGQERFMLLSRATNDTVSDWDLATGQVWWSEGIHGGFGYRPEEVEWSVDWWKERIHAEDRGRILSSVREFLDGGGWQWSGEYRFRRSDGSYAEVLHRGFVLRGTLNRPVRMLGSLMDVTARKSLEKQFLQAQKMEAMGRLAGGVAHDFNNLLTVILGYGDALARGLEPDSPQRSEAEEVLRAGKRAAALTRQLLAFSRRQAVAPKVLDLSTVARDMERMLKRVIGEDVRLEMVLDPHPVRVKADPGQLEQVIMNLAVNARDAMPRGGRLSIETAGGEGRCGGYVVMRVRDTGCGMDEATQARLFEPFFTTKGPGKGTGLGLSTVYGIVRQSGGHIHVESAPGRGSVFAACLPRADEAAEVAQGPETARHAAAGGSEKILLVEDESSIRMLARAALRKCGYAVLEARDGREALEIFRKEPGIDLLLTDLVMPEMGGLELAGRLRASHPGLKVLFMSGYSADEVPEAEGALRLEKPFTIAGLLRKVRDALDLAAPLPSAASPCQPLGAGS